MLERVLNTTLRERECAARRFRKALGICLMSGWIRQILDWTPLHVRYVVRL